MLTVPEAAKRVGRNPETVRRWIRSGRLRAQKVGTQHVIEEQDLAAAASTTGAANLPARWRVSGSGAAAPDWVALLHESRRGR